MLVFVCGMFAFCVMFVVLRGARFGVVFYFGEMFVCLHDVHLLWDVRCFIRCSFFLCGRFVDFVWCLFLGLRC